jgi:elongation factor P
LRYILAAQINFFFMDSLTFEEVACDDKVVGDRVDWLTEGSEVTLIYFNDKVIEVMVPSPANYEVVETEPNVKGNTAQGHTKPATLSCGAVINVPGFVEQGAMIRVDVDKGEYMERVK